MVVCVERLPADKPWNVVSATRRSSGVAPRACVRMYARVLVPPNLYIHAYICISMFTYGCVYTRRLPRHCIAPSVRAPPWPPSACLGFTLIIYRYLYMYIYIYVWVCVYTARA